MGLRRLMIRNNAKHRVTFVYSHFQFADGNWFCWYYIDPLKDEELKGGEDVS